MIPPPLAANDVALYLDVQHFLFEEAALLDDQQFDRWLACCAPEIRYWMPARETLQRRARAAGEGTGDADALPMFAETWQHLEQRVKRLATGQAWAEEPPSRTRRLVTNVRVEPIDDRGVRARSNLLLYRTRHDADVQTFVASRIDELHRHPTLRWQIAARTIVLDATTVPGHNLSIFF